MKLYNHMNNENVPRKNSQKFSDIKIEDYHPYIAEQVKNMPKHRISGKITGQFMLLGWIPSM